MMIKAVSRLPNAMRWVRSNRNGHDENDRSRILGGHFLQLIVRVGLNAQSHVGPGDGWVSNFSIFPSCLPRPTQTRPLNARYANHRSLLLGSPPLLPHAEQISPPS